MKWILILSLLVFTVSCSKDMGEVQLTGASLKCNVSMGQAEADGAGKTSTKSGAQSQTTPPNYVRGVVLTAESSRPDVDDVELSFDFATTNPQNIVMTGLAIGSNTIYAKGISKGTAANNYYRDINKENHSNINDRATLYANQLRGRQEIYTDYESEHPVTVNVSGSEVRVANINMVTESHRLAVVLENSENSEYELGFEVSKVVNGQTVVLQTTGVAEREIDYSRYSSYQLSVINYYYNYRHHFNHNWETRDDVALFFEENYNWTVYYTSSTEGLISGGSQHAIIINDVNATGDIEYTVKVSCYKDGKIEKELEKTINVTDSSNVTRLYHYNGEELRTGSARFTNMSWSEMEDDKEIIKIS